MWNVEKNDTNELTYKTEMDSQMSKTNLQLPKRKSWGEAWIGGLAYAHYCMWTIWSMWTCCVACVQHGEFNPIYGDKIYGKSI